MPEFGTLTEWALRKADAAAAQKASKTGASAGKGPRAGTYMDTDEPVAIEIDLTGAFTSILIDGDASLA